MKIRLSHTIALLALAGLIASGSSMAQSPLRDRDRDWHKGPPSVEEKLARISAALDLSDEQSAQMLGVLQEQERKRAALHEQTMALLGPEICAQRTEAEEAVLSILDEEQTTRYFELKQQRQERAGQRDRRRDRKGGLDCDGPGEGDS